MRIIFMGTPDFAVPSLQACIDHHQVVAVVTQPDKPKGRGKSVVCPPVKELAVQHGIPVYQPARVKEEGFPEKIRALAPDVIVVAAFGQILPESILEAPRLGCINVHGSLLPRYRGAAPIQWAVINGEKQSGVTTMMMAKGLDTGDMLDQAVVPLDPKETGGSLFEKLRAEGAKLLVRTLRKLEDGTAVATPQNDAESSYAGMLRKSMGEIDWNRDAESIERLIRGLNPWPSAYTAFRGKTLKIWEADVVEADEDAAPRTIIRVTKDAIVVQTGQGALAVTELQLEGKKRMRTSAFLPGCEITPGEML